MEKVNKICLAIVVLLVIFIIGVLVGQKGILPTANTDVIVIDTTYNTKVLDSIQYNIIKKDTIVYNLKHEMKDEVAKSFELNDSAAVVLFKTLCTAD